MYKLHAKFLKPLLIGCVVFSNQVLIAADTPLETMMKAGQDTLQKTMDMATTAAEKAKKDAQSAVARLPSYSINTLTQSGEPPEPSNDFVWTQETLSLAQKGDIKRGKELAKKGKCHKCHGDTGLSDEDDTPSIAGQITAYSFKQLHDYKVGLRESKEMLKKVKNLSPKDMADISAYYATQKPEKKLGVKVPVLADKGDPKRFLLACNYCHNDEAMERGYQTPILEGQKVEYFKETMLAFKEGDRVNDHYNLMRGLSAKLTEEEIDELAEYYSTKPIDEDEGEDEKD